MRQLFVAVLFLEQISSFLPSQNHSQHNDSLYWTEIECSVNIFLHFLVEYFCLCLRAKEMQRGRWQVFVPSRVANVSELTGVVYAVESNKCFVFLPSHPLL